MAKKRKYYDLEPDDEFDNPLDEFFLEERDIKEDCGKPNASAGLALYQRGLVSQRSFDGRAIHATIQDGNSNLPVVYGLDDFSFTCSDQRHLHLEEFACEHIAALMYAYVREPESFLPQNIGGFIDLLNKNPQARDQIAATDPSVKKMLAQLQNLPTDVRAALSTLPLNVTPEQAAAAVAPARTPDEELRSLLRRSSLEQLREIAKRRGWKLSGNAKEPILTELASWLTMAPLPAEFSPEEEQLLRLENTLHGLTDTPSQQSLQIEWRARAGGDMARLDRAVRGLQSAGVIFPCSENGSALHYHWLPLIRSEDLPYLAPKAKLYPAEKIGQLKPTEPLMPLTVVADAVIDLAEREPLRVRPLKTDPRWASQPFAQGWELDAQEMEQYSKLRYFPNNAITVVFPLLWADGTKQKLETLAPDAAKWVAGLLFGGDVFKPEDTFARGVTEKIQTWRAQSEEAKWNFLWSGWRAGAIGLTELQIAAQRASLVVQRSAYVTAFAPIDLAREMASARQFVVRLIAPLDPLTWYSFKSFAEYVRGLRGDFLHTLTHQETWFLAASKTRHRFDPNNAQNWDASYRAVLATILDTTLRWTGVTEVAYEGKELAAFRITALGASLLSGGKVNVPTEPADPNTPSITWVDEATIRLRATPDGAKAMSLIHAFADPLRESLTFRVSNASIARAFERGIRVAEIAAKFAEMNAPLPNALRAKMDALAANYGRAHLYEHLTVIELADDLALRELLAGTSLGQFVVHQFSPRLVVVRDENVDAWVVEMVKKGYTPRVMTHEPRSQ